MTLPSLATIDDLETRLGADVADSGQAQALLDYASALIRAYLGDALIDEDGNLVDPLPDGVALVCVEMVFRAVTNPAGATQDTAGPFSVSFGSDAAQRIYLSKSDKVILGGGTTGGLWTIGTTRGPVETPVGPYWDDPLDDPLDAL